MVYSRPVVGASKGICGAWQVAARLWRVGSRIYMHICVLGGSTPEVSAVPAHSLMKMAWHAGLVGVALSGRLFEQTGDAAVRAGWPHAFGVFVMVFSS